jgi:hypothetical protein
MREFKGKLYLGVGSLLSMKAQFDSMKDQYDVIYLSPFYHLLTEFRSSCEADYIVFVDELFKLLFSEPPYVITDDQSYPPIDNVHLEAMGIRPIKPDLAHLLCDPNADYIPEKPYFVLTTKVRQFPKDAFMEVQEQLLSYLSTLPLTPVILGERIVGMNEEYQMYGSNSIYSLYEVYKNGLNCMDMTIEEKGLSAPNLASIIKDCTIMNKAKFNFTVGVGGPLVLALSVGTVVGWGGRHTTITDFIAFDNPDTVFFTTVLEEMRIKLDEFRV